MAETVTPCDGDTSAALTSFGFARTALTIVVWPIGSCRGYAFSILSCCASADFTPSASKVAPVTPMKIRDRITRCTDTSCKSRGKSQHLTLPLDLCLTCSCSRASERVPQSQLHRPREIRVDRLHEERRRPIADRVAEIHPVERVVDFPIEPDGL